MSAHILDVRSLPVLPELADHVIRMALDDEMSTARVAGLIEKDQALTARILSLANSSYYRRSRSIYTVRDAVVVIGFDAVRTVALGVSVLGMFPAAGGANLELRAFWRHSMACALFAQAMMEASGDCGAAKAFCAGLFHDVGKLVLDRSLPKEYARVLQEAQSGARPLYEVENEMLGATHAEVGREVLAHWNLPRLYEEVVWSHHAPVRILDDEQYRISGIVHIANILAHMTSQGASGNRYTQKLTNPLLKRFGLGADIMEALMEKVPRQIDAICEEIGVGAPSDGLFGIINSSNTRLAEISLELRQTADTARKARRTADALIALLVDLNACSKVSDALEKASTRLMDAGLIRSFLGGIKAGGFNLVYEVTPERSSRFVRVGDEELRSMILSCRSLTGMTLSTGVFVYFEPEDGEIGEDQTFLSGVVGAISSTLRRIHMESTMIEGENTLRKALQGASEDKQKAEEALRLNQELMDASSYGLCLVDQDNRVSLENESSRAIRRSLDIPGDGILDVLKGDSRPECRELGEAVESRREAGMVLHHHDRSFRVETKPVKVGGWLIVMFCDITAAMEDQRKKVAYARMSMVGNLAASMAHNMKSPLGAIHGFGSIIKDDLNQGRIQVLREGKDDQDFRDMILNIIAASENLLKIVNQLLAFTRKWESPEDRIDVEGFVEGLFQIVSAQANSAGVKLAREIGVDEVRTRADALEQVLINILINAVKASSQGSEVMLKVSRRDEGVEFAVTDTGIGMDQDQVSRIFDPLYTAWPVKTGMGLGLSLANDIAGSMGGRIDVVSSPGEGSTFSVWIPEGKA